MSILDQSWRHRAMCDGLDSDEIEAMFFPHPNSDAAEAKAICRICPVAADCLTFALETRQEFGVWGGMTEHERHKIRPVLRANGQPSAHCGTVSGYRRHRRLKQKACTECLAAKAAAGRDEYAKREESA